jgi:hypothetical protein
MHPFLLGDESGVVDADFFPAPVTDSLDLDLFLTSAALAFEAAAEVIFLSSLCVMRLSAYLCRRAWRISFSVGCLAFKESCQMSKKGHVTYDRR